MASFGLRSKLGALAILLAGVSVALAATLPIGSTTLPTTVGSSTQRPLSQQRVPSQRYSLISQIGPDSCGTWAKSPTTDNTAAQFQSQYGGVSACGLDADTWVIFTNGKSNPQGQSQGPAPANATWTQNQSVGTYTCSASDTQCLNASAPHAFSKWKFVTAPTTGLMRLLALVFPGVAVVDVGGNQAIINFHTLAWSASANGVFNACSRLWGQSGGGPTSPSDTGRRFLINHPECASAN